MLAHFKLAVILEGIHARFLDGGTVGPGFETIGQQVIVLARGGMAVAERSEVACATGRVGSTTVVLARLRDFMIP